MWFIINWPNLTICGGELKKVLKNSRKRDLWGNILKWCVINVQKGVAKHFTPYAKIITFLCIRIKTGSVTMV